VTCASRRREPWGCSKWTGRLCRQDMRPSESGASTAPVGFNGLRSPDCPSTGMHRAWPQPLVVRLGEEVAVAVVGECHTRMTGSTGDLHGIDDPEDGTAPPPAQTSALRRPRSCCRHHLADSPSIVLLGDVNGFALGCTAVLLKEVEQADSQRSISPRRSLVRNGRASARARNRTPRRSHSQAAVHVRREFREMGEDLMGPLLRQHHGRRATPSYLGGESRLHRRLTRRCCLDALLLRCALPGHDRRRTPRRSSRDRSRKLGLSGGCVPPLKCVPSPPRAVPR